MTTPADYLARIGFQLRASSFPGMGYRNFARTWKAMSAQLHAEAKFGGVLGSVGELDKPLRALRTALPDTAARAAAVVALVRGALAFNGHDYFLTTGPMVAALKRRQGNAAEVNLLLVSALRVAGLTAEPVLLSTRDHGAIVDDEPILDHYNFVLALLRRPGPGGDQLLDATEPHAAFGMLPERCLNTRGRIVADEEKNQAWVNVKSAARYSTFTSGTLTLAPTGAASGTLRREFSGYAGQRLRQQAPELTGPQLLTKHSRLGPDVRVVKHTLTAPPDPAQSVVLDLDIATDGEDQPAPRLYFALKDFGGTAESPFRQPTRQYPVDLGAPLTQMVMLDVVAPAGYTIETLPAPLLLRTPDDAAQVQVAFTAEPDGRSVKVTSRVQFKRAFYPPEEYEALRTVYERLVAKHAEALVFKKS